MVVFRGDTYVILCILKYLPRTSHSWTIGFSLYCCINLVPFPSLPHTFLYYCDLIVFFAFVTPRKPSVQFSSVTQLCPTLCDPMNRSTPGLPVHHQLPEFTQIHIHWIGDAIQPSYPLSSPPPPAFNLSQHQGLFQWVSSSQQVAKVLEFQLQHQSFQWTVRTDLL